MKKFYPILVLLSVCCLSAGGVLLLGNYGLHAEDQDRGYEQADKILRFLRSGESFRLSEVFPQAWDSAQFAASPRDLNYLEQDELYMHDERFAEENADNALMILWLKDQIVEMMTLPIEREGYPRFQGVMGSSNFEVSRDDAQFDCMFIPDEEGIGGYYECSVVGYSL